MTPRAMVGCMAAAMATYIDATVDADAAMAMFTVDAYRDALRATAATDDPATDGERVTPDA